MTKPIYVTRSLMPDYEEFIEKIKPLWDSHQITNMGIYHEELEKELRRYLHVDKISLMVNGHMALELALQAMNFEKGSQVITTPLTFISTTHAIVRNGLTPVFCDIKEDDFTIDPECLEPLITDKTAAILPVHVYGNICDIESIQRIAEKYNLKIIYDAAHAFGSVYKGKGIGDFGDASIFSFHATKIFNTIEGGAVCFHSQQMDKELCSLKNFGMRRGEDQAALVGTNAKMNEFAAVMGLCNLVYVDEEIKKRKRIVNCYKEQLDSLSFMRTNSYGNADVKYNYAYFPVLFQNGAMRDRLYHKLRSEGIYARKYFDPLTPDQPCFHNQYTENHLPSARNIAQRILILPLYGDLKEAEVEQICRIIKTYQ